MHYSADETTAITHLKLKPQYHADLRDWIIHPAMADIACSMILTTEDNGSLPVGIDEITLHAPFSGDIIVCAERRHPGQADFTFFDADSQKLLLTIRGIRFSGMLTAKPHPPYRNCSKLTGCRARLKCNRFPKTPS